MHPLTDQSYTREYERCPSLYNIYISRQGDTDKRQLKEANASAVSSWDNVSTLFSVELLSNNRHKGKQLKNQSLWERLVEEINTKITHD